MKYRKIPFVRAAGGLAGFNPDRAVDPDSQLMNGLKPILPFVAPPASILRTRKDRRFMPQLGRYGAEFANSGFLGGPVRFQGSARKWPGFYGEETANDANGIVNSLQLPEGLGGTVRFKGSKRAWPGFYGEETANDVNGIANSYQMPEGLGSTTVIMRPQAGAAKGWPGFFGWLAATHPAVYNYAKVALPQRLAVSTEGRRTGGATLQGLRGLMGLGDDSTITPDLSTISIDPGTAPTVSIPDSGESSTSPTFTAAGTAQIVNTLTQAATTLLPAINQQQIFQAQLARAQQGLAPLNTAAYGIGNVGAVLGNPIVLIAGVGLLAVFLLSKKSSAAP
jgi:hypothetical protein